MPRLVIGSSVEGLAVAQALQENLEFDAEATVWSQSVFAPSGTTLSSLIEKLDSFDFATFVFTPDDELTMRDIKSRAVRDNVIFETGLFFGALRSNRVFFVMPRDRGEIHLPTDLLGLTPLTYRSDRSDNNLVASLGTASNQLRRAFQSAFSENEEFGDERDGAFPAADIDEYWVRWNEGDFLEARKALPEITLDPYDEDFVKYQRPHFERIFAFLEGLSNQVLAGQVDETKAREYFERAVLVIWPIAMTLLAPPNHADDWWDPVPQIAHLYGRWKASG
jgi:hypothetical protein